VQRHIWKDYEELADDARYTQYRGLAQGTNWVKLKFAAMNLKKSANWKWRTSLSCFLFLIFRPKHARNPVCVAA